MGGVRFRLAILSLTLVPVASFADAVGSTAGSFSVTLEGAAQYTIPITVPPSIKGMQPGIALTYSSNSGDNLVGRGWDISGLSVISRCPPDGVRDDRIRPFRLDDFDRLCLDGPRLMLTSGTYNADGSEYTTEIERFIKVTVKKTGGLGPNPYSGPKWLEVEFPNGQVAQYGYTEDSRIETIGFNVVRTWAINRIEDLDKNFIQFTYSEDTTNGGYRPDKITYTGNDQTSGLHTIEFAYEDRPTGADPEDIHQRFIAGRIIKQTKRLTKIYTKYNSSTIRDYQIRPHYMSRWSTSAVDRLG